MKWFRSAATAVACIVLFSSGAYGQATVHDCLRNYVGSGLFSQEGNGFHQRSYQPMPVQAEPYTATHIQAIIGSRLNGQPLGEAELIGRTITIEFFFGTYDDTNDVFVEDTSLPRPPAMDVVLTAAMLSEAAEAPNEFEQFGIDITVPVPTGKQLHIGLIGHFDWVPNSEEFFLPESDTCTGLESSWYVQPDGPTYGRGIDTGLDTGVLAMRVTALLGTAVPAVSEWGLVAMTLLVMVSGTLVMRKKGQRPAAPAP